MKDEADLVYHALSFWPYEVNSDFRRYTQKVLEIGRENAIDTVMDIIKTYDSDIPGQKRLEERIQQLKEGERDE